MRVALPPSLLRALVRGVSRTVYRLRVVGRENVPARGGALLVPNHVAFVDGLFVLAALSRPVRFVMETEYFHHPLLRPFLEPLGAIPISTRGDPRSILRALRDAGRRLDEGDLVCIFPEGQVTRTGVMNPFRRGLERIAKGRDAPIVPVHLDRVWGSIFSREGGRFLFKVPKRIPYPVTVSFGRPLPPETPLEDVRREIQELGEAAWRLRARERMALHRAFLRLARRRPRATAFADADGVVSRGRAAASAVAGAKALRRAAGDESRIGVLLAPGTDAAVVGLAASLAGLALVPLDLRWTGAEIAAAAAAAGVTTIVAALTTPFPAGLRRIDPADLPAPGPCARLLAAFAPASSLERRAGAPRPVRATDEAAVVFTGGGAARRAIPLSHESLEANAEAVAQVLRLTRKDRVACAFPPSSALAVLALRFAASHGVEVVWPAEPRDPEAVAALVRERRATALLATPSLLDVYARAVPPSAFGSLRLVLTGGSALPEAVADAFEARFGLRPIEGYGTAECSPVVAVGAPDFRAPGFHQPAAKRGYVGQPLPGVAVRVVDPVTRLPRKPDEPGLLLVRGPNVSAGARDLDGWFSTGDTALLDADGFLKIVGRATS